MERKYRYYRDTTSQSRIYGKLPLLEVRLTHGENYIDLDCLVDSGAIDSMFHFDVADELGIDLRDREKREYFSIEGSIIIGQVCAVQLQVKGLPDPIEIKVAFVEVNQMPLLGQVGFFDNYEIRFQRFKERFEVLPILQPGGNKYLM